MLDAVLAEFAEPFSPLFQRIILGLCALALLVLVIDGGAVL